MDPYLLRIGEHKAELSDVVEGIPDLVGNAECDQDVRGEVSVHVGVQITPELDLPADVGLEDGLRLVVAVVLGLAHQGLGDGRDRGLPLNSAVRPDVGDLRVPEPKNVDLPVLPVDVGGHLAPDHLQSLLIHRQGKVTDGCEVPDQVPGVVIRRLQLIEESVLLSPAPLQVQVQDHILFVVQKKAAKVLHAILPAVSCHHTVFPPGGSAPRLARKSHSPRIPASQSFQVAVKFPVYQGSATLLL